MSHEPTSPSTIWGGTWVSITGRFPYFNNGIATGGSNIHAAKVSIQATVGTQSWANFKVTPLERVSFTGKYALGVNATSYGSQTNVEASSPISVVGVNGTSLLSDARPAYQEFYAWYRSA